MLIALRWIAHEGLASGARRPRRRAPAARAGLPPWRVALVALAGALFLLRSTPADTQQPSRALRCRAAGASRVRLARLAERVARRPAPGVYRTVPGHAAVVDADLDGVVQPLAGTEGAAFPFWSPDSRTVAFFAGGKLKKVDVAGGPVTTLADAFSVGRGAWSGGTILFAPRLNGPIHAVAEGGGPHAPSPARPGAGRDGPPVPALPADGRRFLFTAAGTAARRVSRPRSTTAASSRCCAASPPRPSCRRATCSSTGSARLMAQPFDPAAGRGAGRRRRDCRSGGRWRVLRVRLWHAGVSAGRRQPEQPGVVRTRRPALGWWASPRTISRSSSRPAAAARRCSASTPTPATPICGSWIWTPPSPPA